ncbi:MAG: hypothetical protein MK102_16845 [Fuerstiella sp.]|nr:hypothetical protein [Fuerstiella sp.]
MIRKLTLRLCVLTLLAAIGSTANACCLLPFLNPFAWTCGHGCGYGYGYGGAGYRMTSPWCAPACGGGYYGAHGGHHGWASSGYRPSYPALAQSTGCDCTSSAGLTTTSTAFSNVGMTPQVSALGVPVPWTSSPTAFQPQHSVYSTPAPRTAMSTAPIYGPTWQVQGPMSDSGGDIRGDHEIPVIPNGFNSTMRAAVHPAAYRPVHRQAYRSYYSQGALARPWTMR